MGLRKLLVLISRVFIFVSLGLLVSCTEGLTSGEDAVTSIEGAIYKDGGGAIGGATIIAMNRQTSKKYKVTSNSDGQYQMEIGAGHYDLAVHASGYVTYFYGPIETIDNSNVKKTFYLKKAENFDKNRVFGKISLTDGTPAANYDLTFSSVLSMHRTKGTSQFGSATTDVSGNFSFIIDTVGQPNLNTDFLMDINFYNSTGSFVEFIDISKLDAACEVEFEVGYPVRNVYRHYESYGETYSVAAKVNEENIPFDGKPYGDSPFPYGNNIEWQYIWENGQIVFNGKDAVFNSGYAPSTQFQNWLGRIVGNTDGNWFYKYAVHLKAKNTDLDHMTYYFKDKNSVYHKCRVYANSWKWYKISFNSSNPTINKIHMEAINYQD